MARAFNGSSAYISAASVPGNIGNNARSIAMWFQSSNISDRKTLYYEGSASGLIHLEVEGSKLQASTFPVGGSLTGATTLASNTWYHVVVTYDGSIMGLFLNGVSEGAMTQGSIATTSTNFNIGRHAGGAQYWNGRICEVAKYNVVIGAASKAALAKGLVPLKVEPQSLAFYAPLVREVFDYKAGIALTDIGPTTAANHPRTYR